jgi:hypothetical protein
MNCLRTHDKQQRGIALTSTVKNSFCSRHGSFKSSTSDSLGNREYMFKVSHFFIVGRTRHVQRALAVVLPF